MKKLFLALIILALFITNLSVGNIAHAEEATADGSITITGNGVEKDFAISYADLRKMTTVKTAYSTCNNFPNNKIIYAEGVPLDTLLSKVILKGNVTTIKITSSDGYSKTFLKEELLTDNRYYYPKIKEGSNAGQQLVKPIIAFRTGDTGLSNLAETDPVLMFGQRAVTEQNNPWFVKYIAKIELLTDASGKWDVPAADPSSGQIMAGKEVKIYHKLLDSVKVYYTTDGTDPNVNSPMFNKSATYYQPELNKPIVIQKDTVLKIVAVGPGKQNSDIVTYNYTVKSDNGSAEGSIGGQFSDLQGFEWAGTAINSLSEKKIINGIGNNRYNPAGTITRAEFAKIMVLALNKTPSSYQNGFSDVSAKAWYSGYVQKSVELGILNGVGNGKFKPNDPVTREQMIAIVVRALGKDNVAKEITASSAQNMNPSDRTTEWAVGYIALAEKLGLLEHGHFAVSENNLLSIDGVRPSNRGEAAEIVYRMLQAPNSL